MVLEARTIREHRPMIEARKYQDRIFQPQIYADEDVRCHHCDQIQIRVHSRFNFVFAPDHLRPSASICGSLLIQGASE